MKNFFDILTHNFSVLKDRTISIYISGQGVSLLGTWMQQTAQAWIVWQLAHTATALGTIALVSQLPFFIFGPWAGSWSDRLNRRHVLIATQTISMILAFILAFLVQTHLVQLWHVYILAAILGIVNALDLPSQQAFIGDISGKEHVRKTVGLNSSLQQLSRMVGPAIAGWTIAVFGTATAFWINGVSFIAVITSLLVIHSQQFKKDKIETSSLKAFWESVVFIKNEGTLRLIILFTIIQTFFGFSIIQILPDLSTTILKGNAGTLGSLLGAAGAGALVGTLLFVPFVQRIKHSALAIGGGIVWGGLAYMLLALSHNLGLSLFFLFLTGIGGAVAFTLSLGLMQKLAPENMRARLLSALLMISFGLQPIASLLTGFFADMLGLTKIIFFNGSAMVILAALLIWGKPILRKLIATINPDELVEEYEPVILPTKP